jgi:Cu/Ag efflux pump CusA
MRWLIDSSLKLRRLVLALAAGIVILGVVQIGNTSVDTLPEFQPSTVEVQTEALGLSAAEVEQLITVPLEQDLLVGVPFLDEIKSVSLPGLSSVVMTFEPGTDVLEARQVVQERLTQAVGIAGLPAVAKTPQMIQPLSSTSRVAMVKLTSEELSPIEMSVLARWVISPRLVGVPGVANVSIWGNKERQLQVLVDPERLAQNGVSLNQIVRTAGNALEVSPLSYLEASKPGTGGFIDMANQRLNVFHEQTISTPEELAQVPLEPGTSPGQGAAGQSLTLGDVTEVVEDHQPLIGDTVCTGGSDCLLLVIEKFPNANTAAVSDGVDSALSALRPGLADMQIDSSVYRPAAFVEATWENLEWFLTIGAILALLVLIGLFMDWRRTLMVVVGVAVSATAAVLVLGAMDVTVSLLTMAGLTLGLTVMIDDAVSDGDGLVRRVRQHRASGTSAPVWPVVVTSSLQLRRLAMYGALMVAAAATPLFFLSGDGGAFLPPIALAYLLAVAVSMVVSFTVTPALGYLLVERSSGSEATQGPVSDWLQRRYEGIGTKIVGQTRLAVAVLVGITVVGLAVLPFLDFSLRPSLKEREVVVAIQAPPGTSLNRMTAVAGQAVADLTALPGVEDASAQIGRAVMSDEVTDVDRSEVWVRLGRDADFDATVDEVRRAVSAYPGMRTEVLTYTDEQVRDTLDTTQSDVEVRVYGEDPSVLANKADELKTAMEGVTGIDRVRMETTPQESTIEVEVDLQKAQELGVKPGDVRRAAAILLGSITVGNLFEEQKVFDVVVWGAPGVRSSVADLERLRIDTPGGDTIRLGEVADVRQVPNDAVIRHESVARFVELTADVTGRDVGDVTTDVEALVSATAFPLNHHAEVLDGYAERQSDRLRVAMMIAGALLVIFLLFQSAFRSWRLAALALAALPAASVGVLLGTIVTGGQLTLGVLAGGLAVLGTSCRALLLTIGHVLTLERQEGAQEAAPPSVELLARATAERVVPMLATVLGSVALLLPAAVAFSATGFDIPRPAAIAFIGGMVTTSVVALLVVPSIHLRLGSGPDRDRWVEDLYEPQAPDLVSDRA